MGSRTFNITVVLFWLATMSWLAVEKVLPPLQRGTPPAYQQFEPGQGPSEPVYWEMRWNGVPVGWAANRLEPQTPGWRMVNRVRFEQFPLRQLLPTWLRSAGVVGSRLDRLDMDVSSSIRMSEAGELDGFESSIRLAGATEMIRLEGRAEGNELRIGVHSGDVAYRTQMYLPRGALVGDELSPAVEMRGLKLGQSWTQPVYSPLRPPNSPMEILEATVEREELLVWNGQAVSTWVVVYRTDQGARGTGSQEVRGRAWVRSDGAVLRQEVMLFRAQLQFVRLSEPEWQERGLDLRWEDATGAAWTRAAGESTPSRNAGPQP